MRSRCSSLEAREEAAQHALVARACELEVLEHRVLLEHRRALELAADAEPRDLVLAQLREIDASARP